MRRHDALCRGRFFIHSPRHTRQRLGSDSARWGWRTSLPGASRFPCGHPSMTPVPTVLTCTCRGHDACWCSAQPSAHYHPIRLHLHGLTATCASGKDSRGKSHLGSSGSVPSNQVPKLESTPHTTSHTQIHLLAQFLRWQ